MGPRLVTGASDDDPSGIATYSQADARYGLAFLWTALLTLPLMTAVREICDRTALATGAGLGELAVRHFHRAGRVILAVLLGALIVANGLNIGADLVAIGPTVFVTHEWGSVLSHTLIPHIGLSKAYLVLLVAVLGTTIAPYLFFWQSAHRVEEMRDEPEGGARAQPFRRQSPQRARFKQATSRLDVFTGMTFSSLVMFAIIAWPQPRPCTPTARPASKAQPRPQRDPRGPRAKPLFSTASSRWA